MKYSPDRFVRRRHHVKRAFALIVLIAVLLGTSSFLYAQSSIAVLDALVDEGVDTAARVPVTEKIIEALVASGQYAVLDRGNVQQILEEKKFQLSGMVRDSEIKQAGEYLGAQFVCVAKVSRVGGTYFVAAKIIDVETGKIISQISKETRGEIDVVLGLARDVGVELTGGKVERLPEEVTESEEREKEEIDDEGEEPDVVTVADSDATSRHVLAYVSIPGFLGNGVNELNGYIENAITSNGGTVDSYSSSSIGFNAHLLQPIGSLLYVSAGGSVSQRRDQSNYFSDSSESYLNFTLVDARVGAGVAFRLKPTLQVYGGGGANLIHLQMGDGDYDLWGPDYFYYTTSDTSFGFYLEAGADFFAFGPIVAGAQLVFSTATMNDEKIFISSISDYDVFSFGYVAITIGAGIRF